MRSCFLIPDEEAEADDAEAASGLTLSTVSPPPEKCGICLRSFSFCVVHAVDQYALTLTTNSNLAYAFVVSCVGSMVAK
jgi:hypothetical protein